MSVARMLLLMLAMAGSAVAAEPLEVLFLGDQGHHRPHDRYEQLQPVLAQRGIELTYTEDLDDLSPETLKRYDALLVYANIDRIEPAQASALLDYVAQGGGFVPLHCASFCFRNAPDVVALIGAQFQRHGTGIVRTEIAQPDHPVMRGFGGFESWDETYVHHLHNERNRTVLEFRPEGTGREPWTWVRTHGKGRVFYTAWGHDQRTWGHPGFVNLVERGIRWAAGQDPSAAGPYMDDAPFPVPEMTELAADRPAFSYQDVGAKIPNYTPNARWGTQGEPYHQMQLPLSPGESMKHMVMPKGFHVELFASEPQLQGKPLSMNWDERGRLWVAESVDYPNNLQPPGQGNDRIRICEDTDGDGRADRFTVFAENLSIPSALIVTGQGLLVQSSGQTLLLRDTDGDDRADERKVVFTGWNMDDTHGTVSNFQYGLDNWIWAMQGYNFSRPVVQGRRSEAFRQGFFRFRPDGSELEFIRSTDNNTWGLGISEEGIIFGSTANRNPSVYMPIPNRYYESVRGWAASLTLQSIADTHLFRPITDRVRQVDHHGGYTAGAGHALYTARAYPREYWNQVAFVCGPTGHLVGSFVLRPDGAGFHSKNLFNLLAGDDEWFAPIRAEVGPDGQVWVVDWYNYIIQHNPTPIGFETGKGNAYETDLRDKMHSRIYRVVYDGQEPHETLNLAEASPQELVATLRHPNLLWRRHAQRLLVERGKTDVVDDLVALLRDPQMDALQLDVGAIHALWTLHGLGALTPEFPEAVQAAYAALEHASPGVRRNAVQVLPRTPESVQRLLSAHLLTDPHPQVRLMATLALADLPAAPPVSEALTGMLEDPASGGDRWIQDAVTAAAANQGTGFLKHVAERDTGSPVLAEVAQIVAGHVARTADADEVRELIGALGDTPSELLAAIVRGLAEGWPRNKPVALDDPIEAALEHLFDRLPAEDRSALVRLANIWGSKRVERYAAQIGAVLAAQLADSQRPAAERIEAARQWLGLSPQDPEATSQVLDQISPRTDLQLARGLLETLELAEHGEIASQILDHLDRWTPSVQQAALEVLLRRPQSTRDLLEALQSGALSLSDVPLHQRQALLNHPNRRIRAQAARVLEAQGSLPSADREQVLTELLSVAQQTGNASSGKEVFVKHCSKCHVFGGEGAHVGPDLTGMTVHPKTEWLTNILDPNRSVEGNYRVYTIVTTDGRVLQGMLASESRSTLELFDAEGKKVTVLREDVDELVASSKSLMPEGFEKQISPEELTDLLEFLTQRGRYVPLDISKSVTISSARGMFNSPDSEVERLIFPQWGLVQFHDIPFLVIDPRGGRTRNAILLKGPQGQIPPTMPSSVEVPCHVPARALHLLGGVSGWGYPMGEAGTVSMIVRLHYADGSSEDHELKNGIHFADYIRRVDVPESEFAFRLRGQQMRYLTIEPQRQDVIESIELVKGDDRTAPVVMAITVEPPAAEPAASH